jgi:RHH-type proline utilization regulon transcriptional repressor/proline dehydrogenase/delta 1-pyrroline-5-carboxylate dehydrogenase
MTVAALATGNTVIMKPAEQSAVIGAKLMEIFNELGLPSGVLNYLPGPGEVVGAGLVDHPDVALIAFTGSRAVGLSINARAAAVSTKLTNVKRVIAEMGGKNAIIVDDDADLDEAVQGVVKSAFGYQGQKCSACSRAIVLDSVYDEFLGRLVEAARSLIVGAAEDPAANVGPVIDDEAFRRVQEYIALGRQTARETLATDVGPLADEGFYIGPHIYADVAPDSRLAREEIFGPVLAVIRASNFDAAIQIFNNTDYALTGGVFSRRPAHLARARRELVAGNLYLNRGITGALVGRQPFGGFKMSGIGSKAGGNDYLLQFVVPRTITENTMRRGFAPNVE